MIKRQNNEIKTLKPIKTDTNNITISPETVVAVAKFRDSCIIHILLHSGYLREK